MISSINVDVSFILFQRVITGTAWLIIKTNDSKYVTIPKSQMLYRCSLEKTVSLKMLPRMR